MAFVIFPAALFCNSFRTEVSLHGIYMRWTIALSGTHLEALKKLCKKGIVGVWGSAKSGDPDTAVESSALKEAGVTFVNTDLPLSFFGGPANSSKAPFRTVSLRTDGCSEEY